MLSYQHGYHAGGPADLHKHIVLAELLARLTAKPRGITYLETHAGRGLYDLGAAEATKTGEAAQGIGRVAPTAATPFAVRSRFSAGQRGTSSAAGEQAPPPRPRSGRPARVWLGGTPAPR